jgi:outer membrane protein assembly factor BamA
VPLRWLIVIVLAACRAAPFGHGWPPDAADRADAPAAPAAPCSSHRIGRVAVRGAAASAVPQLAVLEGTLDDPERTERVARVAADGLRAQGYADAAIAVARRLGCRIDLAVTVALGRRYRIARIAFDTDDDFPAAARLAVIEDALGTVNTVGGVYIEYRMKRALVELERRYRDAGWLEAELGAPRTTYRKAAPGAADAGVVTIEIPVRAGHRFRIGSVRAVGAGAARDAVLQSLGLHAGEYYDGPRIRGAIERARRRLARWVELRTNIAEDRPEIDLEAVVEAPR